MNLPNLLASLRIVLAPLLFFLLSYEFKGIHQGWVDYFAALVFGLAAMSDFFDGFIARAWGQKTRLGAILDPLADKMLMLGAFLGLLMRAELGLLAAWAIYLILVREFFITGFRTVMLAENIDISASLAGKFKTGFQIVAVIFLIMRWDFGLYVDKLLLFIALILTVYSGLEYIFVYLKRLKERT